MTAGKSPEAALARDLMRSSETAALATLDNDGAPFASHVIAAPAADGSPLLLLSRLALHSRHLARDPRASLLFVRAPAPDSERMTAARLTLGGRVLKDDNPSHAQEFLARHPDAARYAGFADFSFYRFEVGCGHLVAGFGRIVSLIPAELLHAPPRD